MNGTVCITVFGHTFEIASSACIISHPDTVTPIEMPTTEETKFENYFVEYWEGLLFRSLLFRSLLFGSLLFRSLLFSITLGVTIVWKVLHASNLTLSIDRSEKQLGIYWAISCCLLRRP